MKWLVPKDWLTRRNFSSVKPEETPNPKATDNIEGLNAVPVRSIDKYILVWSGKYKRIEDVPGRVSRTLLAKAQSVCRVKSCNYMIVATIIGAIYYIFAGKRDAKEGLTVAEMNRRWHQEYNKNFDVEKIVKTPTPY